MIDLEKRKKLNERLARLCEADTAVAFSGGVDSTLLLSLAREEAKRQGTRVLAVTADTFLHPLQDKEISAAVCRELQVPQEVVRIDELHEAGITDNPLDRCYLCKRAIFSRIKTLAASLGIFTILDGTNADDLKVYRPGLVALEELGIQSPLKEAGLTKEEVRALARERGLSTTDRPSAPCLATRFPYGTILTEEAMQKVDAAETFLRGFGLYNVRVRVHEDLARIEADPEALPVLTDHRQEIVAHMKQLGYRFITMDLEGFRSGSFDL